MYRPRHIDSTKKKNIRFQSIIFIILVLLLIFILLESSFFEIKRFSVTGNVQLSKNEIIQLSGFALGNNIFKINIDEAIKNIELAPLVRTVYIKRKLPATVDINLVEREAAGLVAAHNGFLVVDKEGVYLKVGKIGGMELPVITGLKVQTPILGESVDADGLELALEIIEEIEPQYLPLISEVHIDGKKQSCLYSVDGVQAYLGEAEEIGSKLHYFFSIIEQFETSSPGGEIEYIDLSSKGWPVVQMKEVPR